MSYKQALFVFPESATDSSIFDAIFTAVDHVSLDVDMPHPHLVLTKIKNVKYAIILAQMNGRFATRYAFVESIKYDHDIVGFLGHDDQTGVFLFEYHAQNTEKADHCFLMSNAHRLGGSLDCLAVDYPQKDFTHQELDAILKLDESKMNDAQYSAVAEYKHAVALGMEEKFGHNGGNYLSICHETHGYNLNKSMKKTKLPTGLSNVVAYWPTTFDEQSSGIYLS